MFPDQADRDLARLTRDFELSGGEIRNIVLAAAYLAADRDTSVAMPHLAHALRRELVKNGRVVDERTLQGLDGGAP